MARQRGNGVTCLPVIVAPAPVPLAEWQLLLTSYTRAHSWSSPWVPWPCSIQRGRGRSCQISHLSLLPKECSPPAAGPQGPLLHTPANQPHLWEELASGGCRILFLTSAISRTFEVLCKCQFMAGESEIRSQGNVINEFFALYLKVGGSSRLLKSTVSVTVLTPHS